MRLFSLGGRLALCASMVRPGAALADVGTDHAYLPVWLAKRGAVRHAVASDVRPGPLERAKRNIERWRVGDVVETRLSDGLDGIGPGEADDIVIAGMGGLMMAEIVRRTPWLKNGEKRLILQPMTRAVDLRRSLAEEGFAILREDAAQEEGRYYTAMLCAYDPARSSGNALYPYVGRLTAETPEGRACLRRVTGRLRAREAGLLHDGEQEKALELSRVRQQIESMIAWQEQKG